MRGRLSLKVQIIAVTALAMLCLQITTVALLWMNAILLQQVDDALYRFTTIAVTLEETPDYLHDSVIQANSDNQQILSLNAGPKADDSRLLRIAILVSTDFSISPPLLRLIKLPAHQQINQGRGGRKISFPPIRKAISYMHNLFDRP